MDLENRNIPKDAESGSKRPPMPDWCERCERNEPRRFCRWCQRHVCTEQCWVADSERARRCHECIGAGESAGKTECVRDPVKRSDGDTHVSSSCSWSELPAVQDELPEVLEREALAPFRFNPHAAPFFPHLQSAHKPTLFVRTANTVPAKGNPGASGSQSTTSLEPALLPVMIPASTLDPLESQTTDSSEYIFEGKAQALMKAASILVERVGVPQHPEPLPRSRSQTMPEDPADPARSMQADDAWEAEATLIPIPHNNWRRGDQKCFAPKGLVAPPSTPETYEVPITKGRTQATRKAREKTDQDYVDDAADAGYTIIGVGMYGLTAICSVQDSHKTSSLSTSSAFETSFMQCSVQLPVQVQRCAVCNATLCSDFISSWATTCNECNRIACVIQRTATQPQTAVPSTNREPTTPPRCRYCSRMFEDEARRCDKCRGLMCFSCNLEGAWICRTCGELEEQQDAEKIACAHCKKVYIQRNRRCSYCSQHVCEDCDHNSSYIREKCPRDEQYMRRCWTQTGAASSSKDTSAMHETDEAVDTESRTTISAAISEEADVETDIATSITPEATSSTRALTLVLSPEETQSVANSRSSRSIISTEWY